MACGTVLRLQWIEDVQVFARASTQTCVRALPSSIQAGNNGTPYDIAKAIACEGRLVVLGGLSASHFFDNVLQGIRPLVGLLFGVLFGDSVSLLDTPH
jgi:hypothetical protein